MKYIFSLLFSIFAVSSCLSLSTVDCKEAFSVDSLIYSYRQSYNGSYPTSWQDVETLYPKLYGPGSPYGNSGVPEYISFLRSNYEFGTSAPFSKILNGTILLVRTSSKDNYSPDGKPIRYIFIIGKGNNYPEHLAISDEKWALVQKESGFVFRTAISPASTPIPEITPAAATPLPNLNLATPSPTAAPNATEPAQAAPTSDLTMVLAVLGVLVGGILIYLYFRRK